jgi:hypothetical protein
VSGLDGPLLKTVFNEMLIKKSILNQRLELCQATSHTELIKNRTNKRPKGKLRPCGSAVNYYEKMSSP